MGISGNDRQRAQMQTAMRPIVELTKDLPKDVLEGIVVEAIHKHRYLRDIAELRHAASCRLADGDMTSGCAPGAYVRAMIDVHAQQTVLSTLLDVLGYIPEMPAS